MGGYGHKDIMFLKMYKIKKVATKELVALACHEIVWRSQPAATAFYFSTGRGSVATRPSVPNAIDHNRSITTQVSIKIH